ncbi:hypothetical protein V2H45_23045 [Tumidithrix elongata RA019]|uniref:Uncharacterized protein n=1 Tax=Tumidithrix elongata BACA0141 TaxID=2716417 RepID=A0AAW9PYU5_9CYAN|nr:hypothetical protein [Tumidithrix elongata RA019]
MSLDRQDSQATVQTLVITGNYQEYLQWRQKHRNISNCKYVEGLEDIQGLNGFFLELVLYGTYQLNPVYGSYQMQRLIAESQSPFKSYIKA